MASVTLSSHECRRDLLPDVCARCGSPASKSIKKTFSWHTPLAYLGLLAGLLPFIIIALILTKRMSVPVPMCRDHEKHWSVRTLIVLGSFLGVAGIGVVAVIVESNQPPGSPYSGFICLGTLGLLLAWLIFAALLQNSAIRASEITDRSITLVRVHADFVNALEEDRDRERSRRRSSRRDRYGDARDDYDDEPYRD